MLCLFTIFSSHSQCYPQCVYSTAPNTSSTHHQLKVKSKNIYIYIYGVCLVSKIRLASNAAFTLCHNYHKLAFKLLSWYMMSQYLFKTNTPYICSGQMYKS